MNNKKIYILHGWAYSTEKWKPFIELLKEKNIEFVLLKIPGLTAPLQESWTLDDYVEWLKRCLKNEKGKIILVGHSNGGRISLAFSIKYPEKVAQLFLLDSAGIYHNEFGLWLKRLAFKNLARFKKISYNIVLKNILYKLAREDDYNKALPHMKITMQNLIESDLTAQLADVSQPTVIIWGEYDTTTPISDGELMHERIKNSKLYIIKNARHSPQFTNVQEVVDIIYASL